MALLLRPDYAAHNNKHGFLRVDEHKASSGHPAIQRAKVKNVAIQVRTLYIERIKTCC